MEVDPLHLVFSESLWCLVSRMAGYEHGVEDASRQILIYFLLGVHLKTLWDGHGFQLCESWVGGKPVLLLVDLQSDRWHFFTYVVTSPHFTNSISYLLCKYTDDETFEKRVSYLSVHLNKRGYQKQVIDQAIEKVRHIDRQTLLSYKPKPTAIKAVLPSVMTYHHDLPKVRGIVDKHWSIIESSDHLSTVFPQKPIMAFRRPKSLRDHLVWARLKTRSNR